MTTNPFEPPAVSVIPSQSPSQVATAQSQEVSATILEIMRATKPWVTFLGIVGLVMAALIAFVGVGLMAFSMSSDQLSVPAAVGMMVAYFLFGVLYIFPSLMLLRYGTEIKNLLHGRGMFALEQALEKQKSFWRFLGIMVVVLMALYGLVFVIGIFAGIVGQAFSNG